MKKYITLIALLLIPFLVFGYRDPETGTFFTRDPAGMIDGPNEYTYVRQNPWTHFDPEGLYPDAQSMHSPKNGQELNDWKQSSKQTTIFVVASVPFFFVGPEGITGMGIGWAGRTAYMGLQLGGAGVVDRSISDALSGTSSTTQELAGYGAFSSIAGVSLASAGKLIEPVLNKAALILRGEATATTAAINPGGESASTTSTSTLAKIDSLEVPPPTWVNPITEPVGSMQTIDPASVKAGSRATLVKFRLDQQKQLIADGTPRAQGPPQVNTNGVIEDGHHNLRAAAEAGKSVDVKVVEPNVTSLTNKPVTDLPVHN